MIGVDTPNLAQQIARYLRNRSVAAVVVAAADRCHSDAVVDHSSRNHTARVPGLLPELE